MNNVYLENYLNTYGVQDKDAESTRETFRKRGNTKAEDILFLSTLPETTKANRAVKRDFDLRMKTQKRTIKALRKATKAI